MTYPPGALDVEISVVNHDSRDVSRACLLSLPAACRGLNWHATVVDNASVDGSVDMLKAEFPDVTLVCNEERRGFGVNHNRVIEPVVQLGLARYVLVLNNDTELAAGSVSALVKHADQDHTLGAVGPRTYNPDGTWQPSSFRFPTLGRAVLSEIYPRAAALGCDVATSGTLWLGGACLLLRSKALQQVGVFDPRFFLFFEDIDLARRLSDGGWSLTTCPDASIMHHNHKTVDRDELRFAMACQLRRSCYLYIAKYHGRVPAHLLAMIGRRALLLRAIIETIVARLRRSEAAAARAALFRALGKYDPRKTLPHEMYG